MNKGGLSLGSDVITSDLTSILITIVIGITSIIIAIVIGKKSINIADKSLIYSQRSMLIKESYEPILNDLKQNRKINIRSSKRLNYRFLEELIDSYLYLAFEEDDKRLISSILDLELEINSFKDKSNIYRSNIITNLLNDEIKQNGHNVILDYVRIGDIKGNEKNKAEYNLYDIVVNYELSLALLTQSSVIWCDIGDVVTKKTGDIEYEDIEFNKFMLLSHALKEYLNIKVNSSNMEEDFIANFEVFEKQIVENLKSMKEFQKLQDEYKKLEELTNKLENIIVSRIKKLIIPENA